MGAKEAAESARPAGRTIRRHPFLTLGAGLLAVSFFVVLVFLLYHDWESVSSRLLGADFRYLVMVAALYVADLAIYVAVWVLVVEQVGGRTTKARHATIYCLANVAKRLPGTLWYVGGRAVLYSRIGVAGGPVYLASAIEGTLSWLAGVIVAGPFLALALPQHRWLAASVGFIVLILVNPLSLRRLLQKAAPTDELRNLDVRHVYLWLGLHTIGWIVGGAMLVAVVFLFQRVSVGQALWIIGSWTVAGTTAMLATVLPTNFGITELALTSLLSQIVPAWLAALVAVSTRVLTTLLDIVFGILALVVQRMRWAD